MVPAAAMAYDDPRIDNWNVRKFPKELKLECQSRVKKSGKREPRWLAEIVCTALGLPREVYLDPIYGPDDAVLDAPHEGVKTEVRSDPDAQAGPRETPRGKTRTKA